MENEMGKTWKKRQLLRESSKLSTERERKQHDADSKTADTLNWF
jgi:hypothetical protein